MEPTLVVVLGDQTFPMTNVSVQEMYKVAGMTRYKNRQEWFEGIRNEEPEAQIAAYMIMKARAGQQVRFNEVDFDSDVQFKLTDDTGQEIEPVFQKNDDGSLKFRQDAEGKQVPIPVLDGRGEPQFIYTTTGQPVPTEAAPEPPTSATPAQPGEPSESASGIPVTLPS